MPQKLLQQHGSDAWVLAGGLDSFDWLKDRIRKPKAVVDLSGIEELRGVRTTGDGIEIGAMTTLTEVVNHPVIKQKYDLLAQAAEVVASPQIRNQGTLGGNVSQDTRCWYYRGGWPCYRAGGNICYADTPEGRNREHAILQADRCVAVNPSDTAPALIALDAKFVMRIPKGERVVDAEDYFIGPDIDITRLHILQPGDLLTAIRIPSTWAERAILFRKSARPERLGLPAHECCLSHGDIWRQDRAHPNRGERRGCTSATVESCRRCGSWPAAELGDWRDGGKTGCAGGGSLAVQCLQDPTDEESGETRHQWSRGGDVDFLEWATSPWGQSVPIHIAWFLIWVSVIAGLLFLIVHAIYVMYFAKEREFASDASPAVDCAESLNTFPGIRWWRGCFTGSWQPPCSRCCLPPSFRRWASSLTG